MQTLIQEVNRNPGSAAGCLLLGLMAMYAMALCYGAFRRLYFDREQRALSREWLLQEITAAKLRCQEAVQAKLVWNGFRKFDVAKKVIECEGVASLYLAPHDKTPLPPFKPGQFLTFQLNIPGEKKPVVRCYSLSDSPRPELYRVTIKKALAPRDCTDGKPGLVSSYFYDHVKEGSVLDVRAPSGQFFLDMTSENPVVLISGGVGVTPMLSMLNAIIDSKSNREVWFFFSVGNGTEHMFKEYLQQVAAQHKNVRLQICYTRPGPADQSPRDYHHPCRISVELFKKLLPSNNYDYFMCGPDVFMKTITDDLLAWEVPKERIHLEAFTPTAKMKPPPESVGQTTMLAAPKITLSRSGATVQWDPRSACLLDFLEEHGGVIDSGCRVGNCGSCLVAIQSGTVEYQNESHIPAESGSCLACLCKPKTDLVLDA